MTIFLVGICFVPLRGTSNPPDAQNITRFVRTHLPINLGEVTGRSGSDLLVNLPDNIHLRTPLPAQIFNLSVDRQGTSSWQRIAKGSVVPSTDQQARLKVHSSKRNQIAPGDLVRIRPVTLYISNEAGQSIQTLVESLRSLRQLRRIQVGGIPTEGISEPAVILSIGSRETVLRTASNRELIARMRSPQIQTDPRSRAGAVSPGPGVTPYTEQFEIQRFVRSFDWLNVPGNPHLKILCMTTASEFGCGRFENGQLGPVQWHSTAYGFTLDMSLLPSKQRGTVIPLLIVSKKDNTVYSSYYKYDLHQRHLTRQWSDKNTWIARKGDQIISQTVEGSGLFNASPSVVEVSADGLQETSAVSAPDLSRNSPVFGMDQSGDFTFYLSEEGKFQVNRGTEKVSSFEGKNLFGLALGDFGGSPWRIRPTQSTLDTSQPIHPAPLAQTLDRQRYRVSLIRNRRGGTGGSFSFGGLQSYNDAKLFVFDVFVTSGRMREIWSSRSLTGLITDMESDGDSAWFNLVKPDREHTVFYQFDGMNSLASRP